MQEVYYSSSLQETVEIAEKLSASLDGLIALYGRMGVGKTAFASGFIRARVPNVRVSSPTYTVMNSYSEELYHLDLYRLTDEADLESIGFFDIPEDATVLCEWPERLPSDVIPNVRVTLEFAANGEGRIIKVER